MTSKIVLFHKKQMFIVHFKKALACNEPTMFNQCDHAISMYTMISMFKTHSANIPCTYPFMLSYLTHVVR